MSNDKELFFPDKNSDDLYANHREWLIKENNMLRQENKDLRAELANLNELNDSVKNIIEIEKQKKRELQQYAEALSRYRATLTRKINNNLQK